MMFWFATAVHMQSQTVQYTYDSLDRLISVQYPDRLVQYAYDAAGNRLTLVVQRMNPTPTLTSLAPTSALFGTTDLSIAVNGIGFVETSTVLWNGSARPTAFVSETRLTALIAAADLAAAGTAQIAVVTPPLGGGTSAALPFTIAAACSFTLDPTTAQMGAAGATTGFAITAPAGNCSWSAVPDQSWITITSSGDGSGSGSVTYVVAANTSSHARAGHVAVAGQSLSISQAGAACTVSTTTSRSSFDSAGGEGLLTVTTTPEDCAWTALASDSWISFGGPAAGTGNASLAFIVTANPGTSSRAGAIAVAGQDVPLTQSGKPVILTVATAGTGGGTVTSSPSGINCVMGCSAPFELGQEVTLTASSAAGSLFDRWAGDADCTDGSVTLNTDLQCVAVFRSVVPTNPVPFINTLSPLAVTPGAPDLLLSIEGANIHGDAVVRWNGVPYLPTVVTTTHLEARIPRSLLSSATTAVVTISNPPPGGGVSNEALIHIASPSSDFVFLTSTLGIGAEPSAVTAVDVNADGKPDLIVSKAASSALSVMLGNGDAAFGSRIDVSSGSGPSSVQAADLNHDNRMDLVTANSGSNTVSVFLGAGDGTFSSKTDSVTGTSPSALAVGDFNADGAIDLAVANSGSNTVSVLLGAGDGTFKTKIDYPTGNAPWAIVASDFNGDGSIDVITADRGSSTISLLPGIGDGTFASRSVVSAGSGPVGLAAGDFNGDGRLDLAVANENVNTVSVLLANGPGTFGQRSDLSVANAPRSIVVGDLNADGKLDIVVSNSGSNSVSLFLGAGDGTFGPRLDVAAGTTPTMLARADFDRDGRLDLAVVNEATNTLTILTGKSLAAAVSVSPSSLDFGRQVLGAPTVSRRVIVTNAGSAVLNVSSVMISGIPPSFEITTDGCTGSALPPRADCFVDVRYLAAAIGSTAASLEIRSDASGSPHTIMLAGEATAGPTAPPSLALPAQIVVEATSVLGATVSYVVSATSAAGDAVTVSCVPVSGTRFSIGSTLVSCSAADATGNVATGTFTVVVRDTTPPSVLITSPSPDVLISGSTVAVVVQASDVVGLASLSVNGIAATLSSGTPQVGTWRATVPVAVPVAPGNALRFDALALDAAGNAGTASRLVDNDGIPTALDHSRAEGADQSDRFSNDFNNGTTAGTLTRNGWGTKLSNTPTGTVVGPGGVRTTITGSGAGPAKVSACVGATKEVLLDVAGETADFACNPTTGTITVKALSAVAPAPGKVGTIELREQLSPNGPWQQFNLTTGSSMNVGSPATASASNTAPIVAELRQIAGTGRETVVGSYQLLPGASVDVSATAAGTGRGDLVRVNVLRGRVPITFGGVTRALRPGESATMPIDRRGPSVSCSAADQQWHAGNVNVACIGRENGASFAKSDDAMFSLTTTVEPGVETAAAVTSTREICDVGGGCAVAGPVGGNKVDLKAPTITIAVPAPDAVFVMDEVVAAAFECADGGSGVESCAGSAANGSPVQTASVGASAFSVSATDRVGNTQSASMPFAVTYALVSMNDTSLAVERGAPVPVALRIADARGANRSVAGSEVTARTVASADGSMRVDLREGGFRFDPDLGGYRFDVETKDLPSGTYTLSFAVNGDPIVHTVTFIIK